MILMAGVLLSGLCIGILGGLTGMGGILLPPCMIMLLGMDTHLAMGTSMASMIPGSMVGVWGHWKRGNLDMRAAVSLSAAGIVCVLLGTELKALASGTALNMLLAALIMGVGCMSLRRGASAAAAPVSARSPWHLAWLGGAVGLLSGMTGAGGAVLTIPVMISMGYSPLAAIASGMLYAIFICIFGTAGNLVHGAVDMPLALLCGAGQVAGVWIGLKLACRIRTAALRALVAWVCVGTGLFIAARVALALFAA